jgi:geranylgeranyl diphosphate synthase, type I
LNRRACTAEPLDLARIRRQCDAALARFLDGKSQDLPGSTRTIDIAGVLRDYVLAGGKRIRPVVCVVGWHAAGGCGDPQPVLRAAAGLELFHAFALIHDDIMDSSDTRRGSPSAHRLLAALHAARPDSERLGTNTAILLGDLALVWSDEMLHTAGLTHRQLGDALPLLDAMRTEVVTGQYLDLLSGGQPSPDLDHTMTVIRHKTAKYTVERPLQLGAALAGADPDLLGTCSAYAVPLGEAFQLRDDLLGVFGDPHVTGKPVLDDLREGKATPLMALAVRRATAGQLRLLHELVGAADLDEHGAAEIRGVLEDTGARDTIEHMIDVRYRRSLDALAHAAFPDPAAEALRRIAASATGRTA